ncbi:MAG: FMN-binding protein [Bacteroidales bacterium]
MYRLVIPIFLSLMFSAFSGNNKLTVPSSVVAQDTIYSDGTWEGSSRAAYTDEPYWGKVKVTIKNGIVKDVTFSIRDSAKHETFDARYERHFADIPEYVEQCRNDLKGVRAYPSMLLKNRRTMQVDAISGATWSYNIFIASLKDALGKAITIK